MANDVIFDPILGKLREQDVSGGTGGGVAYEAGPGIDAAALEDGTIAVTGLTAAVSGGTAAINPKGSTVGVNLVGKDGVLVQGNTNGEVEFGVPAVSKHAVFSNSAATLAANTELVAVDNCANMKNDYATFFANFSAFDTLKISHMVGIRGMYFIIDATTIKIYTYNGTMWQNFNHGLTFSSFIYVVVSKKNVPDKRSDIIIMTEGGSYTAHSTLYYANAGPLTAVATAAMTNVKFDFVVTDAQCPVWVFGDSYIEFGEWSWAYQFCKAGHTGVSFNGYGGRGSAVAVLSFNNLISKAIPHYVVWAVGMNDMDSSTAINDSWKTVADYLIEKCDELGVTLIFCTIPNTPTYLNVYKNAYIKASGHRYIDFAHAVNAESEGATWYPDMLDSDDVHPTVLGGEALMHQFIQDFPESVLFEDNDLPIAAGDRIELVNGTTVTQAAWNPVITVPNLAFFRVQPGNAYTASAVDSAFNIYPPSPFPVGKYGLESHLEIFVGKSAAVIAKPGVVLVDPIVPDSVNNCLIRFHNEKVIISVEDHIAGYVVVTATGSTSGTLPYGVASSTQDYIVFDAATNGTEIDLGGAITNGSKHIVGNGSTQTTLTGAINVTSKSTVSLLGLNNVTVSSGTLELGDAYIPNGGRLTIASGGGLEIRNVTGSGTVDLSGATHVSVLSNETLRASGITFMNGSAANGGAVFVGGQAAEFYSCTFSGNTAGGGGALNSYWNANARFVSCVITGNTSTNGGGCFCDQGVFSGCTISGNTNTDFRFTESRAVVSAVDCIFGLTHTSRGKLYLAGSNHFDQIVGASGTVYIEEGAIVDITGTAAATTINPGSGIVVSGTGCTVINSGGTSVTITGGTYTSIKKDGTTT